MYSLVKSFRPREVCTIIHYLPIFKNLKHTDIQLRICASCSENLMFRKPFSLWCRNFKNYEKNYENKNIKKIELGLVNRFLKVNKNENILATSNTSSFGILHRKLHSMNESERVGIEMEKHQIVPDVIDTVPSKMVDVSYNEVKVDLGNELTPTQVQNIPEVSWDAQVGSYYTLIMTDPDAPSRKDPKNREWHHWLVGNIPGSDVTKGETLSQYVGSGPPKGSGLHRYVILVYKQPEKLTFDEPRLTNTSGADRAKFSAKKFAAKYNLELAAGNFYQAQHDSYVEKLYAQLSGKGK